MTSSPIDRRTFALGAAAWLGSGCATSPPPRPGAVRARRVVIIGAGMSGLATAHYLGKKGVDTLVLEASPRAGGRVRTLRDFPDALYAEAGAIFVVGDPDLLALIDELGVPLAPRFKRPRLAHVRYEAGARRVIGADAPEPPSAFSPEEEALGEEGRFKHYFGPIEDFDPRAFTWSPSVTRLDRVPAPDWLKAQGASPAYIAEMAGSFGVGDGLASMSALSLLREVASFRREITYERGGKIAGGTDRLPLALAARLGARVAYGAEVKRIAQHADGVSLTFTQHGKQSQIDADRVVCTVPFPVLRKIEIAPAWSPAKARAIAEIGMTSVTRIHLASRRRFWIERGESGTAETDLLVGRVRDETEAQPGPGGVLGIYATGESARRFMSFDKTAEATALEQVERVHPGMERNFVKAATVAWDDEPFALGAYAFFKPGQLTELAAAMRAPEGRVHFAGDTTSHRPGFMHGALESAKRVVAEIT